MSLKPRFLPELRLDSYEQMNVVAEENIVLSASAGSGKTFSLVTFMLGFLGTGNCRPHEVMALSFTNESARDLKNKILKPLDVVATLSEDEWVILLESLASAPKSFLAWDEGCQKVFPEKAEEFKLAARQWFGSPANSQPWMRTATAARAFWLAIRREAQLLPVTTIHGAALGVVGAGDTGICQPDDPKLVRLLRKICREEWNQDVTGIGQELTQSATLDWKRFAAIADLFMEAQGTWRSEITIPSLKAASNQLLESYNAMVAQPIIALATLTKKGAPYSFFPVDCWAPITETLDGPSVFRFVKTWTTRLLNDKKELKNYFSQDNQLLYAFVAALASWVDQAEGALSLSLEKTLKQFTQAKRDFGWVTYGDVIRQACHYLKDHPLDAKPKLLLIDEFQDVNAIQQLFFERLEAHRMIIVGDIKQGIYGFRGGDSALLEQKIQTSKHVYSLSTNYRSQKPIVDLANLVVATLFPKVIPDFQSIEAPQKCAKSEEEALPRIGITLIKTFSNRGFSIDLAISWIRALAKPKGWLNSGFAPSLSDVTDGKDQKTALLVPRRTNIPKVMRELRNAGIEPLLRTREGRKDSQGIRLLQALLGLQAEPHNLIHLYVILRSPWVAMVDKDLAHIANQIPPKEDQWRPKGNVLRGRLEELKNNYGIEHQYHSSIDWLISLIDRPTRAILAEGIARLGLLEHLNALQVLGKLEPERARRNLEEWINESYELSDSPTIAFFQLNERYPLGTDKGDALVDPSKADLMITTIHQAKGLEYDNVLIPLFSAPPLRVEKGSIHHHLVDQKFEAGWTLGNLQGPRMARVQASEKSQRSQQGMNLLYVALTRAKNRLMLLQKDEYKNEQHLCPPLIEDGGSPNNWAVLGSEIRSSGINIQNFDSVIPIFTSIQPHPSSALPDQPTHKETSIQVTMEYVNDGIKNKEKARREGNMFHELIRELLMQPSADHEMWLNHSPYVRAVPALKNKALQCLEILKKQEWLDLPRRTEFPIAGSGLGGGPGIADLVIWSPNRNHPECIFVVDYKRSIPTTDDLHKYQEQVARYTEALRKDYPGIEIKGFLYNAEDNDLVAV